MSFLHPFEFYGTAADRHVPGAELERELLRPRRPLRSARDQRGARGALLPVTRHV